MNTADQYLKTIFLVEQLTDGPAATGELADRLGVSPASVNEMVGKLEDRGLVTHEKYKGASVTEDGAARARDALQTYCILERFLANVLGVESFRDEARQLEPVIDETVAERLDMIIDRKSQCPDCFDAGADACGFLAEPSVEADD
ncbi:MULTISPECIES: metal-dependent transcriptional regulator [Halobacterium]|uniref:Iron-dependent repressor n=4 Tax=Halobacterium salinarum TaxID=2242 RepID=Q9HRV3_HALSA|nr:MULTISPECIES: metal-dependent transcriptional regulator [Halobacterium]AAG19055.1 iron-dependent repressor [Halobacterium salinarum NRC-1]MBB6089891.1 Mn-dependent DtxR family transcriptional regulator [Halobacterium salinarum]MCF2165619.1 metal-dependent transcriptional regulator [Halobacterium salinarum]MCF2168895.1 metal-dependent transcriptional regulator [Halobacterium salinarum]MCF2207813.1 metal-dependent transcriptional regulator [Halobacterium salinarum]